MTSLHNERSSASHPPRFFADVMDAVLMRWKPHDSWPSKNRAEQKMYPAWSHLPVPGGSGVCPLPVMPASLAKHPNCWSREEVSVWLKWCSEEYSIVQITPDRFNMNGRALCLLTRDDFMQRAPEVGDVLYNALMKLSSSRNVGSSYLPPTFINTTNPMAYSDVSSQPVIVMSHGHRPSTPTDSPATFTSRFFTPSPIGRADLLPQSHVPEVLSPPSSLTDPESTHSENGLNQEEENTFIVSAEEKNDPANIENSHKPLALYHSTGPGAKRETDCRLLWEFIYHLLLDRQYSNLVCWENKEALVFRIINPTGLAELWGAQKNRSTMTYEKLSRALRYYYKMNIINKVQGKRLTYRFLQAPNDIKKGQRGAKPHKTANHILTPIQMSCARQAAESPDRKAKVGVLSQSPSQDFRAAKRGHYVSRPLPSVMKVEPVLDRHPCSNNGEFPTASDVRESTSLGQYAGEGPTWPPGPETTAHQLTEQEEPEDLSMRTCLKREHDLQLCHAT